MALNGPARAGGNGSDQAARAAIGLTALFAKMAGGSHPIAGASVSNSTLVRKVELGGAAPAEEGVRLGLMEAAELADHLAFVEGLVRRHDWGASTSEQVEAAISPLRARIDDERIYLGIVGEFSSGKTTLINAIIHDDLLRTDILQGTTAAATLIGHGKRMDAEVVFASGESVTFGVQGETARLRLARTLLRGGAGPDHARLRQFVGKYSAVEDEARKVAAVNLAHPSEVLREGLVVVDTPGINADNERHAEVTSQALKDLCDAALVIIPADIPVSQTLVSFLRERLEGVLHRCIFLVTKIDVVRPKERDRLVKTVQSRLATELEIEAPIVHPVAPRIADAARRGVLEAEDLGSRFGPDDDKALTASFEAAVQELQARVRRSRDLVPVESLSWCFQQLLGELRGRLEEQAAAYRQRHEALERNRIPDIDRFAATEKRSATASLTRRLAHVQGDAMRAVGDARAKAVDGLRARINACSSKESLERTIGKAGEIAQQAQGGLQARLSELLEGVRATSAAERELFRERFTAIYKTLAALDGGRSDSTAPMNSGETSTFVDSSVADLAAQVGSSGTDKALAVGGGAVAGAVLGSILLPGIGTWIGGAVGGWLASMFGPSLESLKEEQGGEAVRRINGAFDTVEKKVLDVVDQSIRGSAGDLEKFIDAHAAAYRTLVARLIQQDAEQARSLTALTARAGSDLDELHRRTERLGEVRTRLRTMGTEGS